MSRGSRLIAMPARQVRRAAALVGVGVLMTTSAAAIVFAPSAAAAAPAYVQAVSAHALNTASVAVTPASALTNNDRLVVEVGVWSSKSATAASVLDSAGDAFTE